MNQHPFDNSVGTQIVELGPIHVNSGVVYSNKSQLLITRSSITFTVCMYTDRFESSQKYEQIPLASFDLADTV